VVIALKGEGDKKLDPYIKRGINFVLSKAKEEGAIGEDAKHINYTTALSMVAIADYPDPRVKRVIEKARNFLLSLQHRPSLTIKDVWVGGFGYKKGARPDLSNTMFALMALKKTGGVDPEALQRALKFVQRCQNSPYNDQPWSSNDGGFIYLPGSSLAGGTKSYGSMTFSGLLCFAYLDVAPPPTPTTNTVTNSQKPAHSATPLITPMMKKGTLLQSLILWGTPLTTPTISLVRLPR